MKVHVKFCFSTNEYVTLYYVCILYTTLTRVFMCRNVNILYKTNLYYTNLKLEFFFL